MKPIHNALLATVGLTSLFTALIVVPSRSGHSAGGAVPVQVTGTTVVSDTDNAARHPIQFELSPSSSTSSSATDYYNVPAGKRLVIEYISPQLTQYPAGGYGYMYLVTTAGGDQEYYRKARKARPFMDGMDSASSFRRRQTPSLALMSRLLRFTLYWVIMYL